MIENDSTRGDLFYKRGFSNAQMFEYSAADEDFKNAIRLDYRKSDSYYNLALVTLALTDEALAITYLNESLRFNAQNGEAKELLSELLGN